MKKIGGNWVLIAMAVFCIGFSVAMYQVFINFSGYKAQVVSDLQNSFLSYTQSQFNDQPILAADINGEKYFVSSSTGWKIELHDKILKIQVPQLNPTPTAENKIAVETQVKETMNNLIKSWLLLRFKTLEKIIFEVQLS